MFEHSVKVPRHYKVAANIFRKVSTEGGSVKTLLYDTKLRHFRTNVLYALITETIKHAAYIDNIFEMYNLFVNEPRLDPWLAKILTAELLFGKQILPGKSKPEQTILSYKEKFQQYISNNQDGLKTEVTPRPRYVRINTNLLTTSDAIRAFQGEGYHFIRCTSGSYEDYLEQIQKLAKYDFTQDYHVKTIFVFSPGTKLHEHELYLENKIILQDKATAMAVHLLAPPTGSVVLDMCAAPGMKTTQLAAYMRNTGKIYAVERNEKRYQTLCDFVTKAGCQCVETFNKDALDIRRGEHDDVEYILLDPSCSGSGMEFCVHSYIEDTRLAKLTSLQEKFLKHAMNAFPNAKRIVYSTCSLFPEENERVITNVVKTSRAKWRVKDVKDLLKGQWKNFGSGMYGSMGARCMYAKPDSDFTTGFFLAVLDRDQKDFLKSYCKENTVKRNKSEKDATSDGPDTPHEISDKLKKEKNIELTEDNTSDMDIDDLVKKKDKEKDKIDVFDENTDSNAGNKVENLDEGTKKKKRKHENESNITLNTLVDVLEEIDVDNISPKTEEIPKKRKKKDEEINVNPALINTGDISNNKTEMVILKKKKKRKNIETVQPYVEEFESEQTHKKKKHKTDNEILLGNEMQTDVTFKDKQSESKKKKKNDINN